MTSPSDLSERLSDRELDLLIAEKLMGWSWFHCVAKTGVERNQFCSPEHHEVWLGVGWKMTLIPSPPPADELNDSSACPCYSTDIASAFDVVETIQRYGVGVKIWFPNHTQGLVYVEMNIPSSECQESDESAARAICKCALKAYDKFNLADAAPQG